MNIHVVWDNDTHTIIRMDFDDGWTWLTLRRKLRLAFALSQLVHHSVDVIFNMGTLKQLPDAPVAHLRTMLPYIPANWGSIIVVNQYHQTDTLAGLYEVFKDNGLRLLTVESLDQGRALIVHEKHMRATGARA